MTDKVFTQKQEDLMRMLKRKELKRINILEGSVRSGKTWISLVLWAFWVATMPENGVYLMVAKTLTSLRRNCLDLLQSLVGKSSFSYSLSKKEGRLFGRLVYLEGVNDARAESKIRGMTLTGAYCDEVTLFTEEFFTMLLSRLSDDGAKLIGTTNPDNPHHWLMAKYLTRQDELSLMSMKFTIEDNTFLGQEYVEALKKEYTGVYYDRFILGLWKAAEGVIYDLFANGPERFIVDDYEPSKIAFASIGVDFGGNKSAHAFVCTGFTRGFGELVTLDEFYLKEKISPAALEAHFIAFARRCKSKYKVYEAYCDSAETTLIQGLTAAVAKARIGVDVIPAIKGRINDRIRFYNAMMGHERYKICRRCSHTIEALQTAVWDDKSIEDKRLDDGNLNIDSLDAMEYSSEKYMNDFIDVEVLRR